jgi:hypothetical protein
VRGLNEGDKQFRVRNLLRQWKAYIICLQETKLDLIFSSVVQRLWIGVTQLLEGPMVESCLCGIGGLWRRLKSVWR